MSELMRAVVLLNDNLTIHNVGKPQMAAPGHLIIKMNASAINSGDKFFLKHPAPPGMAKSLYDIKGVSGVGIVEQCGEGVPGDYLGKNVTIYRSLKFSETVVGTWCEYSHVPFLDCVILPHSVDPQDYSGSMVNIITPLAFLKEALGAGHKAIVSTAGNSATGIAMLGLCLTYNIPLLSIVRTARGKRELEELGAKNIVIQSDPDFSEQFAEKAQSLNATAIFDGVGGGILNKVATLLPYNSTIYSYGYIGDAVPFTFHTSMLSLKKITIRPFSNVMTETVKNADNLKKALKELQEIIAMPHFKTKIGQTFNLEDINEALLFTTLHGGKAVLTF